MCASECDIALGQYHVVKCDIRLISKIQSPLNLHVFIKTLKSYNYTQYMYGMLNSYRFVYAVLDTILKSLNACSLRETFEMVHIIYFPV